MIEHTELVMDTTNEEESSNIDGAMALLEKVESMEGDHTSLSEQAKGRKVTLVTE